MWRWQQWRWGHAVMPLCIYQINKKLIKIFSTQVKIDWCFKWPTVVEIVWFNLSFTLNTNYFASIVACTMNRTECIRVSPITGAVKSMSNSSSHAWQPSNLGPADRYRRLIPYMTFYIPTNEYNLPNENYKQSVSSLSEKSIDMNN